jgi:hypothetical protein
MCPPAARATAAAIPGAELVVIEGMGHGFPRALWPEIASRIATLVRRVEAAPASDSPHQVDEHRAVPADRVGTTS